MNVLSPINQLSLFGYENYFQDFCKLYDDKKLPNTILLSGKKGLGKSTFAFHFSNYLLSKDDKHPYLLKEFNIDALNKSYNLIQSNIHPNFFLVDNKDNEKDIKIEQIKNLHNFLNKSTYSKDLKIVFINNIENLNLSSSNSLLKALEEPSKNTFFFLIQDSDQKILHTIKSRCIEFKIYISENKKIEIFNKISSQYSVKVSNDILSNLRFFSPGNLLILLSILDLSENYSISDEIKIILNIFEKYLKDKKLLYLNFITTLIHKFYINICIKNENNFSHYLFNRDILLNKIYNLKKYNLNDKNFAVTMKNILINDKT